MDCNQNVVFPVGQTRYRSTDYRIFVTCVLFAIFNTRSTENVFFPHIFYRHFDLNVFDNRFNCAAESKVTTVVCFTVIVFPPLL